MELRDLVTLLLTHQTLAARQWVADAERTNLQYQSLPKPTGLDATEIAVAAGVVELLARRAGESPPTWTSAIGQAPTLILLVRAAATLPRLRHLCETEGPEPLRRRGILAPPDFLTVA